MRIIGNPFDRSAEQCDSITEVHTLTKHALTLTPDPGSASAGRRHGQRADGGRTRGLPGGAAGGEADGLGRHGVLRRPRLERSRGHLLFGKQVQRTC